MRASVIWTTKSVEFIENKDKDGNADGTHNAMLKGYQSNKDQNGETQYTNLTVFVKYTEKTQENIDAIIEEISNSEYGSCSCETFIVNSHKITVNEKNGTKYYNETMSTPFVKIKVWENN